ncbi:MAG: TonB-dependent receptor [Bacteroidia bacterium]|nr:TonB-dependent receptor [Bacteroidia bacterium]
MFNNFYLRCGYVLTALLVLGMPVSGQNSNTNKVISTGQTGTIKQEDSYHNIHVITSEEIDLLNYQSLNDALWFTLNNFSVYNGRDGYSLNYNGTGRKNIKILMNGMPMFMTSMDNFDLSKISLIGVDRIEIVRGSSSVFNGPNAALATVNIITEAPANKVWNGKLNINTSSRGDLNAYLKGSFNFGRHSITAAFGQYFFSGVGGTDSFRVFQWKPRLRDQAQLNYSYQILNDLKAYLFVSHIYNKVQDRGYPIPNTLRAYDVDQITNLTTIHAGIIGKISKYHHLDFSHSYTNYLMNNYKTIKILSTLATIENNDRSAFDRLHYDEYFNQIKLSKTSPKSKLDYETGLEFSHQRDLERSILTAVKTNITQLAILGNVTYQLNQDLRFKSGLRFTNSNKFTTRPIYELGMRYKMADSATLLTNYSSGFRTPTFNEMFYTFENPDINISGNLNLQSETYNQFNTTLRIKSNKTTVYTTLFWANSNNGIQLSLIDSSRQLYQFVNTKATKLMGQNIYLTHKGKALDLTLGLSNNGINQFPEEVGNYYFYQEVAAKAMYTFHKLGLSLTMASKYVSEINETRPNTDITEDLTDFRQDPFWLVDLSVKKRLFDRSIFALIGVKNMTNTLNVSGAYLPLDRLSDENINTRIPISIDYGRRIWFSLITEF